MGKGRIKGITIEIGGDTSKLDKSLKDIDSSLAKTERSLRDVNKLLKFDPKNTELLKQKQQLLAEKITDTKKRLEQLKQADVQAKAQLEKGELGKDKYDALQREIIETEGILKSLEKQAKAIPDALSISMQAVGTKMQTAGDGMQSVGKKLMPVSAGAAAVGTAAGKMAIDFEDSMANINTLLDDTSNLEGYESAIKDMSRETGISLDVMSSGMYQTISSIGDGGKETEKIFKTMGKSAKAGGAEVSDAVSLISAGMKGYGKVNDETANKISDLAFQTAKLGVTTFPEMARSMQPLFPLASSLGFSLEELFGSMATLTGVTGNTSEVTTQLKAVMSGLMKPTGAMSSLIQEYGYSNGQAMIEAEGFTGVLQILQEATGGQSDKLAELFGSTEALTAMTALTGEQFDTFKDKLESMSDSSGATQSAYEKMETSGDKLRKSWNNLKVTGVEFGAVLMDILAPIIESISKKVQQFSEWFSKLSENQKKTIVTIGMVIAALGPALVVFGKLTSGIGNLITHAGSLITKLGGLQTIFTTLTGPIGIAIAAIAACVGAVIYLYNTNDEFREFINVCWEQIKEKISTVLEAVKEFISAFIEVVKMIWNAWGQDIVNVIKTTFDAVMQIISPALDLVSSIIKTVTALIKGDWSKVWEGIKGILSSVWNIMKGIVSGALEIIKSVISSILNIIKSIFSSVWESIKSVVSSAIDKVKNTITNGIQAAKNSVSNVLDSIKNAFSDKLNAAKNVVKSVIDKIKSFFKFEWSLPKLKMPHVKISGKFNLLPPSAPHFSIDWYSKAMNGARLLKGAQIFGSMNGNLLGGGEVGEELVMGKRYMLNMIRDAVGFNGDSLVGAVDNQTSQLLGVLNKYFPQFANQKLVLDSGILVGGIMPTLDARMGEMSAFKERGL